MHAFLNWPNGSVRITVAIFCGLMWAGDLQPVVAQCHEWVPRTATFWPTNVNHGHALAFLRGTSVIVTGVDTQGSSTWLWAGRDWGRCTNFVVAPPPYWTVPEAGPLVYDPANDAVLLYPPGSPAAENVTWTWDGSDWQFMDTASPAPGPRYGHAMAGDTQRRRVVLFGGSTWGGPLLGDTWEWDGQTWAQMTTESHPSARIWSAMAYDSRRGVTVLFGGDAIDVGYVNDTWEWDGVSWTQSTPSLSPSPRGGASMAYDELRGVCVLYGGKNYYAEDTWEWDGDTWVERSPSTHPPNNDSEHHTYSMTYDSRRRCVLLYGGTNTVWEYPNQLPPIIHAQPTGVTVCLGSSFELSVEAEGAESFQWRKNGQDIPDTNAPTLVVETADYTHEGNYDVRITNGCGSVLSAQAAVSLCAGPGGCPSPADVNGDGNLDGLDIQLIVAALLYVIS